MKIQVLGSGCANCKKLHEITQKAIDDLKMDEKAEYVTELNRILEMGIMTTPALVINDKLVASGPINNYEKIKEILCAECDKDKKKEPCECEDGECEEGCCKSGDECCGEDCKDCCCKSEDGCCGEDCKDCRCKSEKENCDCCKDGKKDSDCCKGEECDCEKNKCDCK